MLDVYVTFPNKKEALRVGEVLVKEKLAACVNIVSNVKSIFYWKNKLEKVNEVVLIAKVSERNYEKLEKRVIELHSYEVPCITALKVERGYRKFIEWVESGM
jgi:periplasmic divalent cation tolerance protein